MRFQNKTIFLHLIFIGLMSTSFAQIPWPVFPSNQQPDITGTLGEFRGSVSSPRFHRGTDITNGSDFRVFAIEAGTVTSVGGSGCNKYVEIQNAHGTTLYYHIDAIVFSGPVAAGQQIGSMTTTGGCAVHLHIQRMDQNFLENGFSPFVDHTLPTLYAWSVRENGHSLNLSGVRYSQDAVISGVVHRIIGNKVDLVLNADDTRLNPQGMSPGVGAVAPFKLGYQVLDIAGNSIGDTIVDNIDFSKTPLNSHAGKVFGVSSTSSNYNWIMTSHPSIAPADRYWNTGIRQGAQEDWADNTLLDATLNLEAQYPDDQYMIRFSGRDVDFMSDTLPGSYNEETLDAPIIIDNFRPYIQKVVFQQDTALLDSTDWLWDGNALSFRPDTIDIDKHIALQIYVHSSEPLRQLTLEIPEISFQQTITTSEPFSNNRIWAFNIDSMTLLSSMTCEHVLQLSGLDYANNSLETNPANLSVRQSISRWSPSATPGKDQLHSFQIPENCFVGLDAGVAGFGVEIYPNPAQDFVWIQLTSPTPLPYDIRVWGLLGQEMFYSKVNGGSPFRLPVKGLPDGIYLLEINTKSGKRTKLLHVSRN